jgi:3-hydroxyisobutyrate dehydrogenase-like beta-hydroxyacid dehydrogenase
VTATTGEGAVAASAIAFIGFGEAAEAFLAGFRSETGFAASVATYDIKTDSPDPAVRASKRADYARANVVGASSAPEAVAGAGAVFSVVTADQAHAAAVAALPGLAEGAFFFDCDSCAPQTKVETAKVIDAAGGRYVDVAVMAPVHPRLHKTPLLVSGPHARLATQVLAGLGMQAAIQDGPVGAASSVKMIRSVMMKGLEALVAECALAGTRAGVLEPVLNSLDDTYPGFDWGRRAAYMLERMTTHGLRRAAEMREVALTVAVLGLDPAMSEASVRWQETLGGLGLRLPKDADAHALADKILASLDAAAAKGLPSGGRGD